MSTRPTKKKKKSQKNENAILNLLQLPPNHTPLDSAAQAFACCQSRMLPRGVRDEYLASP